MARILARRVLLTGRPAYVRAFRAIVMGRPLTVEERHALDTARTSDGSYPVPSAFDPTVRGIL